MSSLKDTTARPPHSLERVCTLARGVHIDRHTVWWRRQRKRCLVHPGGNMRSQSWLASVSLLLSAVACTGRVERAAVDAELRRDLALASGLELPQPSYRPVRFVSAIESSPESRKLRSVPRPASLPPSAATSPAPQSLDSIPSVEAPAPAVAPALPSSPTPEPEEVPRIPIVAPRPVPVSVDFPAEPSSGQGGAGPREGPDIGTIIGVVIRGGSVGVDRCAPPRRVPPRRLPIFPHR
jgi:hypothetical protein